MAATTAHLGLTKPDYTDAADIAVMNSNMDVIDGKIEQMESVIPCRDRVANLLDNSDFRSPVNQRGETSYSTGYAIDRWNVTSGTLTVNDGYITVTGACVQYLKGQENGTFSAFARTYSGSTVALMAQYDSGTGYLVVTIPAGSYVWAALYEGSYTADALPTYMPKGYAAELLECQRYYLHGVGAGLSGCITAEGNLRVLLPTPVKMRSTPNVTDFFGDNATAMINGAGVIISLTGAKLDSELGNGLVMCFSTDLTAGDKAYATAVTFATNFNLSAEL